MTNYIAAMGGLQLYIFRQLVWWTLVVAASLTCVVWLTQSLRFVEMIVNRGLSAGTFIYFTLLLLPTFLSLIAPVALFVAAMFVYNKLITDNELVVMRAAGVSPATVGRPAIVLALAITVLAYVNTIYLMPTSFRAFKDLQRNFRSEFSAVLLQEGVFNPVVEGITVYIRERSPEGELYGIIIHDERTAGRPVTMMAERGAVVASPNGPRVVMENGNRQEIQSGDGRLAMLYFDRYTFDLSSLKAPPDYLWREPRERYLDELFYPSSQESQVYNYHKLRMEGYYRLATPLLNLAFLVMGLALLLNGDFNRRGQLMRVVSAVALVIAVEVVVLSVKSAGERMPWLATVMWALPVAMIAASGALLATGWWPRLRRWAPEPA